MIEAVGLTKRFGGRVAVEGVSLRVEAGEVVGLLGPNGAGKTTLLRLLLGVLRPDGGVARRPDRVGYVPEQQALYDQLTVLGHLRFVAAMQRVPPDEIDRAVERLSIGELRRRPIGRLSHGQRQRVALAAALLGRPPAYVLDEALAGLDPLQVADVRTLTRSLAADGAAVLLSTHVLSDAAAACDRLVILAAGQVRAEARPADLPDVEGWFQSVVGSASVAPA